MSSPTALSVPEIKQSLKSLPGWRIKSKELVHEFKFKDYYETMAFVNAIAYVSHQANHHPDLEVGYNTCVVRYSSHSVGGLTENDFFCAGKVDALAKDA